MLEVGEYLVLSTAHLTEQDARRMTDMAGVYDMGAYGFMVYVSVPYLSENTVFVSVRSVISFARRHDFKILILDRDGPIIDELPTYDW